MYSIFFTIIVRSQVTARNIKLPPPPIRGVRCSSANRIMTKSISHLDEPHPSPRTPNRIENTEPTKPNQTKTKTRFSIHPHRWRGHRTHHHPTIPQSSASHRAQRSTRNGGRNGKETSGAYGLDGGEDGGEADGLVQEHVGALHPAFRKLLERSPPRVFAPRRCDRLSVSLSLPKSKLGGEARRETTRGSRSPTPRVVRRKKEIKESQRGVGVASRRFEATNATPGYGRLHVGP